MNWQSREDERVAHALEGAPLHGREDRGVVALAERIREVPAATGLDAAPDFRAALRARVLAEGAALLPRPRTPAEVTDDGVRTGSGARASSDPMTADAPSAGGPGSRPPRARHAQSPQSPPNRPGGWRHRRRTTFAATALVIATLSATTVAASGDARPGDPLYGLKRKVQGVELIVARTDVERGQRHLDLARIRVGELSIAGPTATSGPLMSTLDDMDTETRDGVRLLSIAAVDGTDEGRLSELAAWTAEQRALLTAAMVRLPEGARARAVESLALLATVAARIEELRASLRCDGCSPAAGPDELGPQPCRTGCRTAAPAATPPVQTQTKPASPGTVRPSRPAPVPSWPGGPVGTVSPGRMPTAPGPDPVPPPGPTWPNPEPPSASPTPSPVPPEEPPPPTEPPSTTEPAAPESVPKVVTGIFGGGVGVLGLTK